MKKSRASPSYFTFDHVQTNVSSPVSNAKINMGTPDKAKYTCTRRSEAVRPILSPFSPVFGRTSDIKENSCRKLKRRHCPEDDFEANNDSMSSVTVAVRVRPLNERESGDESGEIVKVDSQSAHIFIQDRNHEDSNVQFSFDHCFDSTNRQSTNYCNQEKLYKNLCEPLLHKALNGFNVCIFAYGQTGSGKSYTIMGTDKDNGIIPRFAKEIFMHTKQQTNICLLESSFYEIYNEKIFDLLADNNHGERQVLRIREHPQTGPYVENLTVQTIDSIDQLFSLLVRGNKNRATASTIMNDRSSRSHAIFTIQLVCQKPVLNLSSKKQNVRSLLSKINFVDLAGSERASYLQSTGERLKEGNMINKSLLTLGKVITLLADGNSQTHIPYRDSTLTFLLKECLGGNSSTCMIATISPSALNVEETLSTLRYASKARKIVNKIKNNIHNLPKEDAKMNQYNEALKQVNDQISVALKQVKPLVESEYEGNKFLNQINNLFSSILNA